MQIIFVMAFGFVASALTNRACALWSGHGSFRVSFASTTSILTSFVLCMFAGPYLALENGFRHWLSGKISINWLMFAIFIGSIWSFCAGIFVIQFLAVLGVVQP